MHNLAQAASIGIPDKPCYQRPEGSLSEEISFHCLYQLVNANSLRELILLYSKLVTSICPDSQLLSATGDLAQFFPGEAKAPFHFHMHLVHREHPLTTLKYGSDTDFHWERLQRLKQIQSMLGPILWLHCQLKDLKLLSRCDGLTGLHNRRSFEEQLLRAISQCHRHDAELALMIIDLDHFKKINDTHGHLCGDQVLCQIADTISSTIRSSDNCFRLGGDEFAIILDSASEVSAQEVTQRLRTNCNRNEYLQRYLNGFSVGSALWRRGESWQELYQRADLALYQIKRHRPCE